MYFVSVKGVIKWLWEQSILFRYDHCYDRTDLGTINYISFLIFFAIIVALNLSFYENEMVLDRFRVNSEKF